MSYIRKEDLDRARSLEVTITPYESTTVAFTDEAYEVSSQRRPGSIAESAVELIGDTPMVRLNRLAKMHGIKCELVAKCEFLSVGGSVKDRIGRQMIEEAEQSGRIKPGAFLVEASSGNTGIAFSLVAAVKGYKAVITMPEKMSKEKEDVMCRLGAQIIRTPNAAWNVPESHIGLAHQLQEAIPNCHLLDQYFNPANPRSHYGGTAVEIIRQCDGKIDAFVASAGTGGTLTGIAKRLREVVPTCRIVGVDPQGSILAEPARLNEEHRGMAYSVEGIGYDFIPSTLNRSLVGEWIKSTDKESYEAARELMRYEGLLVGGSSGSTLAAALKVCKSMKENERCVVLLADSCRNYINKFMSDPWMMENGHMDIPRNPLFGDLTVGEIPQNPARLVGDDCPVSEGLDLLKNLKAEAPLVVTDKSGVVVGLFSAATLLRSSLCGTVDLQDSVLKHAEKKRFRLLPPKAKAYVAAFYLSQGVDVLVHNEATSASPTLSLLEKEALLVRALQSQK